MIIHNPILTGSFTYNGADVSNLISSSANITSLNAATASLNTFTASAATTGSNTFVGNQVVSGSLTVTGSITTPGTLTAQTLVVQTITSSVDYVTGSTRFGSLSSNTHVFTGSMSVSGSANFSSSITATQLNINGNGNEVILTSTDANGQYINFATSGSSYGYVGNAYHLFNPPSNINTDLGIRANTNLILSTGGATEKVRISSAGNVGIGTTNPGTILDVKGAGTYDFISISNGSTSGGGGVLTKQNATASSWFGNSGGWEGGTSNDTGIGSYAGGIRFYTNGGSEKMRIASGGSVGIGTTSPGALLHIYGGAQDFEIQMQNGNGSAFLQLRNGATGFRPANNIGVVNSIASGSVALQAASGGDIKLGISTTEMMRITPNGFTKQSNNGNYSYPGNNVHETVSSTTGDYVNVFTNTSTNPYGTYIRYSAASPNGSVNEFFICGDTTNVKFVVLSSGTVQNRTGTYGTLSSDIRLKENVIEASSKLNDLLKLRVVNFNLIDDASKKKQIGFIAQEFKEVFPSLVFEKDTREYDDEGNIISGLEDALGINVGMEFAILVKAIQELKAEVDDLKSQLNK